MKALALLLLLAAPALAVAAKPSAHPLGDAWCQEITGDPAARFVRYVNPAGPRLAYCRVYYGRKMGVTLMGIGEAPAEGDRT